jgi:hypothetical protein
MGAIFTGLERHDRLGALKRNVFHLQTILGDANMAVHKSHEGPHDDKLCAMTCCPGRIDLKALTPLVKDPKYICSECGRAAAKEENLCSPKKL